MLFIFVVDTSVGAGMRAAGGGMTFLDMAKAAVERFRDARGIRQGDAWVLVSLGEGSTAVKASFGDSAAAFYRALRELKPVDLPDVGHGLRVAFELARQFRLPAGVDSFGHGRLPTQLQPAVVVLLTKGGVFAPAGNVTSSLMLPKARVAGSELVREPFRWDHLLFALVLPQPDRASGSTATGGASAGAAVAAGKEADAHVKKICKLTGGHLFTCNNRQHMMQNVDKVLQRTKVLGPICRFAASRDASGARSAPAPFQTTGPCMITSRSTSTGWPIPEEFRPGSSLQQLPPRSAHPMMSVDLSRQAHDPKLAELILVKLGFPVDVYDISRCSLTDAVYKKRGGCYPVYVTGSAGRQDNPRPCGFVCMSTDRHLKQWLLNTTGRAGITSCVLCLAPYNYSAVWKLVAQLAQMAGVGGGADGSESSAAVFSNPARLATLATRGWRDMFEQYVRYVPHYYVRPLRVAMHRYGLTKLMPPRPAEPGQPGYYNKAILSYLQSIRIAARAENERLQASGFLSVAKMAHDLQVVKKKLRTDSNIAAGVADPGRSSSKLLHAKALLATLKDSSTSPAGTNDDGDDSTTPTVPEAYHDTVVAEEGRFDWAPVRPAGSVASFFSISSVRSTSSTLSHDDPRVNVPMADMGDYGRVLAEHPPLRDPLAEPDEQLSIHDALTFSNPYASEKRRPQPGGKRSLPLADEADLAGPQRRIEKGSLLQKAIKRRMSLKATAGAKGAKRKPRDDVDQPAMAMMRAQLKAAQSVASLGKSNGAQWSAVLTKVGQVLEANAAGPVVRSKAQAVVDAISALEEAAYHPRLQALAILEARRKGNNKLADALLEAKPGAS